MKADDLLRHYARIADAPAAVARLRRFILDLAVRGKLVRQDHNDEPAAELLVRIVREKARLVKMGALSKARSLPDVEISPYEIPCSWRWTRIREIASDRGQIVPNADFTYIDVTAINKEAGVVASPKIIRADQAPSRARKIAMKGDVIYSCVRPYLLNVAVIEHDFQPSAIASTAFAILNGHGLVLPRYIWIALRSSFMVAGVEQFMRGQVYPAINDGDFSVLPFPLPPLPEQHRIVATVDELMALCDRLEAARAEREAARNRLAAASLARLNTPDRETFHDDARFALAALPALTTRPDQIKQLRQTILNLAVRGKLVRQNANDEPAPDLLRRLQKGGLGPDAGFLSDGIQVDDLPLGWARVELSSIANVGTGLTPSRVRPEYFDPPTIPWVTSGETSESSISTTAQHISPLALRETGLRVYPPGTLLVAMYGQGKTRGQVAELKIAAATNQACAAIVLLLDDRGHRRYIKLFFEKIYEEIRALSAGGAQPNLNVGKIKSTTIPFPPLEEQLRIVAKVDELMALCDRLEASLASGEDHRRRLLEALLQQALQPADTLAAAA